MNDESAPARPEFAELRRRAEALVAQNQPQDAGDAAPTTNDVRRLIHELDVHRIELAMQNDDLSRSQGDLERARDEYSALFEMAPVGYFRLDAKCRILQVNVAGADLLGMDRRVLTKKRLHEFVAADDQDGFFRHLRRGLRSTDAERCELEMQRSDGSRFLAHMATVAQMTERGRPLRCLTVVVDITERKKAEEALREADRRKNEFLATLAHELRNPLVPIRNAVHVLARRGTKDSTESRAHDLIERQLGHMVRLIEDLLDVSRAGRSCLQLRRGRVDLTELLREAAESMRPRLDGAGLNLQISLPREAILLEADDVRLTQVFVNLLDNALKYTPGGGLVSLSAQADETDVTVAVADSGIGIPAEFMPRVFEMFAQIGPPGEAPSQGLGIGLWLAASLVELHGGTITAKSEGPGQGSEFVVRLPRLAARSPEAEIPPAAPEPSSMPSRRILVVDDDHAVAESFKMLLELDGHVVEIVCKPTEAIAAGSRFGPDVVLLDIGMPGLNGYTLCRQIREQPWGRKSVVIAMTGWGGKEDRRKSAEAGFDAHLVKPVKPADLQRVIFDATVPAGSNGASPV
jgi:PAS domain S-box-containing protein